MRNKIVSLLLISLVVLACGCKSKRALVKAPLKEYGVDYLLERMTENQLQFNTISMKASITAKLNNSKDGISLGGTIRIVRDSIIWISLSPGLGIEAARLYITQDSVLFMDRINGRYFASTLNFFNNNYQVDLDFNMLQGLLLGNDFNFYEYSRFKVGYDGNSYKLTANDRQKQKKYVRNSEDARRVLVQTTLLNPDHFKIESVQIKVLQNQNRKLQATYSGFTTVEGQLFPSKELFELNMQEQGKSNSKQAISISFSRIELDKELKTPFSIPDKYTPMTL